MPNSFDLHEWQSKSQFKDIIPIWLVDKKPNHFQVQNNILLKHHVEEWLKYMSSLAFYLTFQVNVLFENICWLSIKC